MRISRRLLLVIGLVVSVLSACSPDDSSAIQTQTQVAKDAFSTRVASVRDNAEATTSGQDLISALVMLDTVTTEAVAATPTLPATVDATANAPADVPTVLVPAPVTADVSTVTVLLPATQGTPLAPDAGATIVTPTEGSSQTSLPATTPLSLETNTPALSLIPSETEAQLVQNAPTATPLPPTFTVTLAPTTPPQNVALTSGITVLAGFDGGIIDHLTNAFASFGQLNTGAAGALDIDRLGNLYVGNTTGILIFPEACAPNALPSGDAFGIDAGLADIQGIDASGAPERLLVVDSSESAPAVVAFTRGDSSVSTVAFRTTNLGGKRPWDLHYDSGHDRLFVTTTDGNVLVFDDYFARGGTVPPSRIITPFDGSGAQPVAVDLHGIDYAPSTDTLILSDVGGSVDPNDGQLLLIDGASQASGNVPVRAQIRGANTLLGDPSDIAFDGTSLYVAENFNGFLLRYDNILAQSGVLDVEANSIGNAPHVRSLTVALQNPGGNPLCSLAVASVPTAAPSETAQDSPTPLPSTSPPTNSPPTQNAVSNPPAAPPTEPPATQVPPTNVPATQIPPTHQPPSATRVPPTRQPPSATRMPPTQPPPTSIPPTPVPPTALPPTPIPPTPIPPTPVPPTQQPPPTSMPPTPVPPTQAPPAPPPTQPPPQPPPTQDNSGPGGGDEGPGGMGMGMGMGSG